MIEKREILQQANKHKLNPIIIEKDYILGWMIAGIFNNETLSKHWVFKGGTSLKKCYFHDYRFSEDLDYTLTPEASIDPDIIKRELEVMALYQFYSTFLSNHVFRGHERARSSQG